MADLQTGWSRQGKGPAVCKTSFVGKTVRMRLTGVITFALVCLAHPAWADAFTSVDRESLSAAVLAETNRERAAHGLRQLQGDARLARAAEGQTKFLTLIGTLQHESFLPGRHTVEDRVRAEGLRVAFVSENLAKIPVQGRIVRRKGGAKGGFEIVPAELPEVTTQELAAMLVRAWMDSPGHRENLLNPRVTHLGCSVQTATGPFSVLIVYSAQVFARM